MSRHQQLCFLSPYLGKHFGGGEKYLLDSARLAAESKARTVSVAIPQAEHLELHKVKAAYERFFGFDLSAVSFISTPLFGPGPWWQKLWWTKQFDSLYYSSDGSLFFTLSHKRILHLQVPFTDAKDSLIERLKLSHWQIKNSNSDFTKAVIEKEWRTTIDYVHHPLVDLPTAKKESIQKKEKLILCVGRFFSQLHSKKQDILVEIFQSLQEKKVARGWQLVFVGPVEDEAYFSAVKKMAQGLAIEFQTQTSRSQLLEYYDRASLYWHAAGFGTNEQNEPEKQEHFGISLVEAMRRGVVPLAFAQGGPREIMGESLADLLWKEQAECLEKTLKLIQESQLRAEKAQAAVLRSEAFGKKSFQETLEKMLT